MILYPAIDLRQGRVVRLEQGRIDKETVYFDDPAEPAARWKEAGAQWIHVVDLDGAFTGSPANTDCVARIVEAGLKVQLGGGLRTPEAVAAALDGGASRVVLGTRAAESETFIAELVEAYGERIAVGIDAKDGRVAVKGWVETSDLAAVDLAKRMEALGVQTIIYTDISRDGMLTGPNFEAQAEMLTSVRTNIIASGGVTQLSDIVRFARLAGDRPNLAGVITGKALYDGRLSLSEALQAIASASS